jgi:hypothetical protein
LWRDNVRLWAPNHEGGHLRRKAAALIDEDQASRVKIVLAIDPIRTRGLHISAHLLASMGGFFICLAVPVEKLPHRGSHNRNVAFLAQPLDHLVKRRVRRLRKRAENESRMRIKHGTLPLALPSPRRWP